MLDKKCRQQLSAEYASELSGVVTRIGPLHTPQSGTSRLRDEFEDLRVEVRQLALSLSGLIKEGLLVDENLLSGEHDDLKLRLERGCGLGVHLVIGCSGQT